MASVVLVGSDWLGVLVACYEFRVAQGAGCWFRVAGSGLVAGFILHVVGSGCLFRVTGYWFQVWTGFAVCCCSRQFSDKAVLIVFFWK